MHAYTHTHTLILCDIHTMYTFTQHYLCTHTHTIPILTVHTYDAQAHTHAVATLIGFLVKLYSSPI